MASTGEDAGDAVEDDDGVVAVVHRRNEAMGQWGNQEHCLIASLAHYPIPYPCFRSNSRMKATRSLMPCSGNAL